VNDVVVDGGRQTIGGPSGRDDDDSSHHGRMRAVINAIRFARLGGTHLLYVSTGWLNPYDDQDVKVEDILKVACQHYHVMAISYRLPFITINSKGGFKGDHIVFQLMKACRAIRMWGEDGEGQALPLLPADAAGNFVVRCMVSSSSSSGGGGSGGGATNSGASPPRGNKGIGGRLSIRKTVVINALLPVSTILDWVDETKEKPIVRGVDNRRVMMAMIKLLTTTTTTTTTTTIFSRQDMMGVLGKDMDDVHAKIAANRSRSVVKEVIDIALYRANLKKMANGLKQYIDEHPHVVALVDDSINDMEDIESRGEVLGIENQCLTGKW